MLQVLLDPHLIFVTKYMTERKGSFSQLIHQASNPDTVPDIVLGSMGKRKITENMEM